VRGMDIMLLENKALRIDRTTHIDGEYYITKFLQGFMNKNTQKAYGKSIYQFFDWWVDKNTITVKDLIINPSDAGDYNIILLTLLQSGKMKTSTYNARIKGIRSFYEWLMKDTYDNHTQHGLVYINPFGNIKQLDTDADTEGSDFLSENEIMLMLNNPYGDDLHIQTRNRLLLLLALTTGIRKDALVSLKKENLQYKENEWCIITIDKGRKKVEKAIKEEYYNELMEWYNIDSKYRTNKDNSIFNIRPETAGRMISKWAKWVGIVKEKIDEKTGKKTLDRKITFHSLRTTSAIQVYKLTGNIYEVQKFMINEEVRTTEGYTDKDKKVIKIGKNLIDNLGNYTKFDDLVQKMNKAEIIELLLNLDEQTKAKLLMQIQK
jgi:integrase